MTKTVEALFHDSTTPTELVGVTAVVHGPSAVTFYTRGGIIYTYPWCNVQRIKEAST